jgi:hypothetical protein
VLGHYKGERKSTLRSVRIRRRGRPFFAEDLWKRSERGLSCGQGKIACIPSSNQFNFIPWMLQISNLVGFMILLARELLQPVKKVALDGFYGV